MNKPPKVYSVTKNGEHMGIYQEPGNCAKAVEGILGRKVRGRGNIVPQIAKLAVGGCLDFDSGVKVFRVRPVDEPSEPGVITEGGTGASTAADALSSLKQDTSQKE